MTDIAELGYKIDSSGLVEGTKALDDNAAAADKAGAAADRLESSQSAASKTASYWANEQAKINARVQEMERIEQRAAMATRQAATATEAHELNLQQLLGQINPTVAALNKLADQQDRLARARDLGLLKPQVWQQYQNNIDATRASILNATGAQNGMGMSARQLQNNLRMIPMQVTDITTSLISGQPAWMVAIQQGGQLNDQFGGIGPAARAVGGYVLGLINPLTLGAAVLAALTLALKQGSDELYEFQRNLILSGRDVGVTFGQFERMVDQLDRIQGVSRGGAVDALNAVAKSGQFAGQQLDLVAASAARMESSLGVSADRTVALFDKITKDPVDGLLELQKQWGRVTQAQIDNVYQLQLQGDELGAVTEALRLAEQATKQMADTAEANLPMMTMWWRDQKDEISGAWGQVVGLTQALTGYIGKYGEATKLPTLTDIMGLGGGLGATNLALKWAGLPSFGDLAGSATKRLRNPNGLPENIEDTGPARAKVTDPRQGASATDQWNRRLEMYDKEFRIGAEIERIEAEGIAAGRTRAEIEATIANYMKSQEESAKRKAGVGGSGRNGDDSAAQNMLAAAQRQIEANKQLVETGVKVTESERQAMAIEQVLAKGKNTMTASTRALLEAAKDDLLASGQKAVAYTKEKEAAEALARQQAILAQAGSNRSRANELDLLGMSGGSDGVAMLRRQLDIQREYQDELKRLGSRDVAKDKATWDLLAANADAFRNQELAKERAFQDQRLAMLGDWRLGAQVAWQNYAFDATNYNQQAQDAVQGTLAATTSSIATQIDELIRGNQSLGESFKNIAVDMGNAVIGALEQMAAQWLVYKAIQLAVGDSTKASASSVLVGNAAATAAQAALAAYASTAAIPIVGPAMAPGAAQAALSATAPYVAAVAAASTVGMAHDGIHSVPTEGTWLLNKGERVLTAGTAAKMDATLDRIAASRAGGPGGGGNVYAPTIHINGDPDARTLTMVEQSVRRGMQQNYDRISSELTTGQGRVGKGLRRGNNVSRRVS
ncbi:phage tail length tape measure family protein [Stenotrophomonas maltophilia]|uniref:phage tail length tape measure family protein n=1 Tax=Stenotrophomonas maltophilia TaxID=40324 RepID=UPI0015DDAEAA|nr:phage tail length tape measure family protein [Stenotrophomonas maltophilia]